MPCSDHEAPSTYEMEGAISQLKDSNQWYEAALCALITQVQTSCDLNDSAVSSLLRKAEDRGGIDSLVTWWDKHRQDDIDRMEEKLNAFSTDEKKLIKTILNSQEL